MLHFDKQTYIYEKISKVFRQNFNETCLKWIILIVNLKNRSAPGAPPSSKTPLLPMAGSFAPRFPLRLID